MPTTYAHDLFGKNIYPYLPAETFQKDHPQKPESFQNRSPWSGYTILLYDQTDCYPEPE